MTDADAAPSLAVCADPSAPTITTTRLLRAPLARVFDALTKPALVQRWFAPPELAWALCEMDAREGQGYRWVWSLPDGTEVAFSGEFTEIISPERIVRTFRFDRMPESEITETLTLEAHGEHTILHTHTLHSTLARRDGQLAQGRMQSELHARYARLDALLDALALDPSELLSLVFSRDFSATPARLWAAHTDLALLAQWFVPKGTTLVEATLDLRPQGTYHYVLRLPDDSTVGCKQVFASVTADSELVSLQSFCDPDLAVTAHPFAPDWPHTLHVTTRVISLTEDTARVTVSMHPHDATPAQWDAFDRDRGATLTAIRSSYAQLSRTLRAIER
ncbi:MAG: SRPBCC domain-containing protein [Deltaproteobacteria bacterium]|nr:SRPBCC domain-containing protein [Deltaproteobacteria bacterium]